MSEHWSDVYLQQITDCENRDSRLNDWERGFIDSLQSQIHAGTKPTMSQIAKLDEVWERATARG